MANLFDVPGSNRTITWEAEPATRGTFTLLSVCVVTLFLCVWSSVHLNLPGNDQGYWPRFIRRISWIAGALFAPEYLILTAWIQRQAAKRISEEVEETFKEEKNGTGDPESQLFGRKHPWTMTHSFWAIMGGIAIDSNGTKSFIPGSQRSTLTRHGVSILLKHEPSLLPDISIEEVKDKSKGSSLTKFLALVQATWFCMSCVARVAQHLPLSLLELNTFAHALCTVVVYLIWWRKPLDIQQPLVIQDEKIRPLSAYMWMASKTSCIPKPKASGSDTVTVGRDPEFEAIIDGSASVRGFATRSENSIITKPRSNQRCVTGQSTNENFSEATENTNIIVTESQDLPGTGFRVNKDSTRWIKTITRGDRDPEVFGPRYISEDVHHLPAIFDLTPLDVRRWRLAREALDRYDLKKPNENLDLVTIKPIPESTDFDRWDESDNSWAPLGFTLLATGYGGLHALGWNARFPTHRELTLWRVSALIIASPAALVFLFTICVHAVIFITRGLFPCYRKLMTKPKIISDRPSSQVKEPSDRQSALPQPSTSLAKDVGSMLEVVARFIGALGGIALLVLYLPARGYLVYESFRTVFFLPPEAYEATRWTQYLPHIT